MHMITLTDALRAQPCLAEDQNYLAWVDNDDWSELDAALARWGFGPTNDDGEIVMEDAS